MKKSSIIAAAIAALALASCSDKAQINGKIEGAAEQQIIVKQLNMNVYNALDTIKTKNDGSFRYNVQVAAGQPEFIYLFHGNTRIAGLLLEKGDKVSVKADTLGNYSVEGSEESAKLAEVDKAYTKFINDLVASSDDNAAMSQVYLKHYRASVKHLIENPYSLTTIPVLYQRISEESPVFAYTKDALFFKNAADSLKKVYPESRYVKALDKEAKRKIQALELENVINAAPESKFPDIVMPDMNGEKKALASVEAKAIIVHFWDASDAVQKMLNIEELLPLYNDYHKKGLEIYSVCLTPDKALWGSVVSSQKLPWINVNDGLGAASPAVVNYNVASLPNSIMIVDGELNTKEIKGVAGLRKELDRILRR